MRKTIDGVTVDVFSKGQKIAADSGKDFWFMEETRVKSSNIYNVRAMDSEEERICFLKFARYDSDGNENWQIKNLRREGAFRFQCPYIERVYESFTGTDPDGKKVYCVAVEYIFGKDLLEYCKEQKQLIEKGELTEEKYELQMFRNMLQLLYGVRYYMNFSLDSYLHRDLKPENLMIDQSGSLRIVDFDYAHITGSRHTENSESWGLALSRGYTDPRTLKGIVPDKMSDVYSIGRIFFYWLNGYPYYRKEELENNAYAKKETLAYGLDESRLQLKYMQPEYEKLRKILKKACGDPEKEERYQDADEILDDLEDFILGYYETCKEKDWYLKIEKNFRKRREADEEHLCNVIMDGTGSFAKVFPKVYDYIKKELKNSGNKKYGLTVFHNSIAFVQTVFKNGQFFTDDINEFLEAMKEIEFFGGCIDGREEFSTAIRQAMYCLNQYPGKVGSRELLLFSDSIPKEGQMQEEFKNVNLSKAVFWVYSEEYAPKFTGKKEKTKVFVKNIAELF